MRLRSCRLSLCVGLMMLIPAAQAGAGLLKVAIVHADISSSAQGTASELMATGLFASVHLFDSTDVGVPTLADLATYDVVLAYTNFPPDDPTALGDTLADYVDAGGHGLVLATYGLGDPSGYGIGGRIATSGYSPFVTSTLPVDPSGSLIPESGQAGDPIFSGVDLNSLVYYHDFNFANPGLDAGATLLATDGAGMNLIARDLNGRIVGLNLFPGAGPGINNGEFYKLLANSLLSVAPAVTPAPEPGTILLGFQAIATVVGLKLIRRKRRCSRKS